MSATNYNDLKQRSEEIKNETQEGANTAQRVGSLFEDINDTYNEALDGKQDANTALDDVSGVNTGDETTASIQTKRPIKTVNGETLEGSGNIVISGGGGGNVNSVNGETGNVVLSLDDLDTTVTGAELDQIADAVSDLSTVATSGDYDDLVNKPSIPENTTLNNTLTSTATDEAATANVAKVLNDKIEAAIIGAGASASPITKNDWDGVVTTWDTGNTIQDGHQLFAVNVFLVEGEDYTVSGSTITYAVAPLASEVHTFFPNVVVAGSGGGSMTGAEIVAEIDEELGGEEWKSGLTSEITDITEYANVTALPIVTGDEIDVYAWVNGDDLSKRGLYTIIGGAWQMLYHFEQLNIPVKRTGINEIDLSQPVITTTTDGTEEGIIDGYQFNLSANGVTASASKYISNFIPVRKGDYLLREATDRFWFYDYNKQPLDAADMPYNFANKFSITNEDVHYVRISTNITNKNTGDMVVKLQNSTGGANPTGWSSYGGYERDNEKYTYETNGLIWKKETDNLFNYKKADYAQGYNNSGATNTSFANTGLIPVIGGSVYAHNAGSNQHYSFWEADGTTFISGTIATNAVAPINAKYMRIQMARATDFKNIIINQNIKTFEPYYVNVDSDVIENKEVKNVSVCLVGDSIGTEDSTFATESSYASMMRSALKLSSFNNVSVSGKLLRQYADDINTGRFDMPFADYYLITVGTNDFGFNVAIGTYADDSSVDSFHGNIKELVEKLLLINPDANILFITPIPRSNMYVANAASATLVDYRNALIEYCNETNTPYLDGFEASKLDPLKPQISLNYTVSDDGLHPNNNGHRYLIYPQVVQWLKAQIK